MALLNLSLQAVYDGSGNRVFDARLSLTNAGTNVPAPAYSDAGFSALLPSPIPLRGNGTWPPIYVPDGSYRLRITDFIGGVYDEIDGLSIASPTSGGGGGSDVDDKRLAQTGDVKDRYSVGTHPGWVRGNGRTIGSSASSATERANDDCEALFIHLWTQDSSLAVSGGRGDNAATDWATAKTIALPDFRGRSRFALSGLGSTDAGRLNGGRFTFGNPTTLGSYGGEASHIQTLAEMAVHNHVVRAAMDERGDHAHAGTTSTAGNHFHQVDYFFFSGYGGGGGSGAVNSVGQGSLNSNASGFTRNGGDHSHTFTTNTAGGHTHAITATASASGSGAAMSWLPPFILVSTYIKL